MPTALTPTNDSYSDIAALQSITSSREIAKSDLLKNDEISASDKDKAEIVLMKDGKVANSDGKEVGTIKVEGDQVVFTATDANYTGTASFEYGLRLDNQMPPTKATVELQIISEREALEEAEKAQLEAKQKIARETGTDIITLSNKEDAKKLTNETYDQVLNNSKQDSYIFGIKKRITEIKPQPGNVEYQLEELNKAKALIPLEWQRYVNSLNAISTTSEPTEALKQYELIFEQINSNSDKKAQAVMLHALLKSASNLSSPEAKFVCQVQTLVFCAHHGILPEGINVTELDTFARNLPINFGHHNGISAASFSADFLSLFGGLIKGGLKMASLIDEMDEVIKDLEKLSRAANKPTIEKLRTLKDKVNSIDKSMSGLDDTQKAAKLKEIKNATKEFRDYSRSLKIDRTKDFIGDKSWQVTNSPKLIDAISDIPDQKFDLKGILMNEDSLANLYKKQKDNSLLSVSTGMDAVGAVGVSIGVTAAFAWTGPLAPFLGTAAGIGKFTMDSWQHGRNIGGIGGDHIKRFDEQYDKTQEKLSKFAGPDYSELTGYTPSSSYSSSSSTTSTSSSNNSSNATTVASSGNPSPFACA